MDEATYNATELATQARKLFGTTPEVVTVALRMDGKETHTIGEAQGIVREFLQREVN